ncbi:DUF397 domain-containing protein [Actinomadura chibensis]|uniref:DUF397 domain-containing protein n=1 Tax=Actinomadura chibensis TaxID=392828 RepID=A0A5D0NXU1_9ACTN|nr:DUF397 domain-containing protein [Actinomadura chibensis]TYB48988.1 DUF397 domain-containing protein [Actinomadura chibensis]
MTTPAWRKSSRSTQGTSEQCLELAQLPDGIGLRDSKSPDTGHLVLTRTAFADLVQQLKHH